MPTYILGISAYFHDSAAVLLCDGKIVAAAQEERFTRVKHDAGFPSNATRYCLDEAGIELSDVQHIAYLPDQRAARSQDICDRHAELDQGKALPEVEHGKDIPG